MEKTHWRKLKDTNFLGSWDIVNNELILTIKSIITENVQSPDGKTEQLPVMHFIENYKPMILNATNFKNISKALNSNFIEDWINKKISIYVTPVKAFGQITDALRIKPNAPKTEKQILTMDHPKFNDIMGKLTSGETTVDTVKQYFDIHPAVMESINVIIKK
jgi:hypothetical protein